MLILGITGGSGSGKTTVVRKIMKVLPKDKISILSQDAYYKDNGELSQEEKEKINFDHPDSIEFSLLNHHIRQLTHHQPVEMPTYSYTTCRRGTETIPVFPTEILIVEGILILTHEELRSLLDLKVYVDSDADDRLIRIIQRDVHERGRGLDKSIQHYESYVKPMHNIFIEPTKRYADIIIPIGGHNDKGIDILTSKILQTIS
ncbi:MAG: uridine kinase [Bacteroidales bacterium]|jgi:uridine kinase|nr:uridine kinase [Bacteroidales bacterium]